MAKPFLIIIERSSNSRITLWMACMNQTLITYYHSIPFSCSLTKITLIIESIIFLYKLFWEISLISKCFLLYHILSISVKKECTICPTIRTSTRSIKPLFKTSITEIMTTAHLSFI